MNSSECEILDLLPYLSSQIKVSVISEVDESSFCCRWHVVYDKLIFIGQFVGDHVSEVTGISLFAIPT